MACEFLVLNGAKINAIDADGNTALHLAALHGSTGQVLIIKYNYNDLTVKGGYPLVFTCKMHRYDDKYLF